MVFVYSEDLGLIANKKKELALNYSKITNYYYKNNIDELLAILMQFNLFEVSDDSKKEIIFINNFVFTNDGKTRLFLAKIQTIKDKKIVVISNESKIDNSNKKYFNEFHEIKKLNKWTLKNFVNDWIKKNKIIISTNALEELLKRLPTDAFGIKSELEKLLLWSSQKIDTKIISNLVLEDINQNIFNLIDNYFNDDFESVGTQLRVFENKKIDFKEIFFVLVSQLFLLRSYIYHFQEFKSFEKLIEDFVLIKYQIEKWSKLIYNLSTNKIDTLIFNLLKLEVEAMKGERDLFNSLRLFLFNT